MTTPVRYPSSPPEWEVPCPLCNAPAGQGCTYWHAPALRGEPFPGTHHSRVLLASGLVTESQIAANRDAK